MERDATSNLSPARPSGSGAPSPNGADASALASALAPALLDACEGRLSKVEWFRSTWQSGGAATGYATFRADGAREPLPVVVKLPVGPAEYRWTTSLSDACNSGHDAEEWGCTPRVFACGTELGGHDLAWLVVERLSGPTVASTLNKASLSDLLECVAEWYDHSARVLPVTPAPDRTDWESLFAKARDTVRDSGIHNAQRWNTAIKHVQRIQSRLIDTWRARPINTWCHGDLHPGNAMRRNVPAGGDAGEGRCVLIDLALVHPGHWVEDAVYLERQFWGVPERLCKVKPVSLLHKFRRQRNLENGEDYVRLAEVRRLMTAACVPAFLAREGHPTYTDAALETLERLTPRFAT